jgi:NifU-like protein involved in Fe-S cluster formation
MSGDPRYGAEVLRRLRETPGAGEAPPGASVACGRAGDREQGIDVRLQFEVEAGRVRRGYFQAFGCPHVIAAASWLTERARGLSPGQLAAWDWREAARALEVPPAKFGRLLTIQDAVRAAARNWPAGAGSTV